MTLNHYFWAVKKKKMQLGYSFMVKCSTTEVYHLKKKSLHKYIFFIIFVYYFKKCILEYNNDIALPSNTITP